MPKIILHPLIQSLSGKLGDVVFRVNKDGTVTVTKTPDMTKVKWSKGQKAHRRRFKKAVAYAKAAMQNPDVWAAYQERAATQKTGAWGLAMKDHFAGIDLLPKKRPAKKRTARAK